MSKRGKLSKSELYVVQDMMRKGHSPEEIAEFLGRTVRTIDKFVQTIKPSHKEQGYVVLDEASSQRGDEISKYHRSHMSNKYVGAVHKIKPDA